MELIISEPVALSSLADVHPDRTEWGSGIHCHSHNGRGKKNGWTPKRPRASYFNWERALSPRLDGQWLCEAYGVYLIFFSVPSPHLYVGTASDDGRKPEGVFNRLKKHIVKATGSHVGVACNKHGGVNHTKGWRSFAAARAIARRQLAEIGAFHPDDCRDAKLAVGRVLSGDVLATDEASLTDFETCVARNTQGARHRLARLFGVEDFTVVTTGMRREKPSYLGKSIRFWDGSVLRFT